MRKLNTSILNVRIQINPEHHSQLHIVRYLDLSWRFSFTPCCAKRRNRSWEYLQNQWNLVFPLDASPSNLNYFRYCFSPRYSCSYHRYAPSPYLSSLPRVLHVPSLQRSLAYCFVCSGMDDSWVYSLPLLHIQISTRRIPWPLKVQRLFNHVPCWRLCWILERLVNLPSSGRIGRRKEALHHKDAK